MIRPIKGKPKSACGKCSSMTSVFLLFFIMTKMTFCDLVLAHILPKVEIEGIWQGTLKFSGMELRIIFNISQSQDSKLTAVMDVPEQNAAGVPVDEVVFDNRNVRLEITSIEGVFKGKLAEDGDSIHGEWSQGGMTLPLVLERTDVKFNIERPQEPKEPFPYHVEEVVFKNRDAGITFAGTLTFPPSGGPFPAVLLLSGSGPQDRDEMVFGHRPFLVLADYLTRSGIAVLRFDDRGVGGSSGDFNEATAVDFAADAMAGVAYLKSRKEINHEWIGLIGHSEGGMIAPMAAVQSSDIAFIVMIASPGLPIEQMEYSELVRTLKSKGANNDFIIRNRILLEKLFTVIRQETNAQVVQDEFTSLITEFLKGLSEEERKITEISEENLKAHIHEQFHRLHSNWFRFYLPYDPGTVLRKITCSVIALNGEKDVQVPARENLRAIEKALRDGGNTDYSIRELPHLNHLLQTAETGSISEYGKIEETMSPTALQIICDWILEITITG